MKTIKLTFLLLASTLALHSKSSKFLKHFEKSYVKVKDSLYVDHTETTNSEYHVFLEELKKNKASELIRKCMYDSTQWISKFPKAHAEPWFQVYHSHVGYSNYPIVNISMEAANEYCKWLTNKYNGLDGRKYKKVVFRLPTDQEWRIISSPLPGHRLPWYGNSPYSPKNLQSKNAIKSLANVKIYDYVKNQNIYSFDGYLCTSPIGCFGKNELGVYDIIGNVSEMTSDGKIKGGSWGNYIEECFIDLSQDYEIPDPRVGFRLVMEVIE